MPKVLQPTRRGDIEGGAKKAQHGTGIDAHQCRWAGRGVELDLFGGENLDWRVAWRWIAGPPCLLSGAQRIMGRASQSISIWCSAISRNAHSRMANSRS